ncbi:MAG TPA: selenocysteine-specific translation elongation factor [Acidimicrobiales bacterium]|jgi:selenocysteine-specific elongation factor|nr:selenocysteine-specific translation elongation factor [Acidimicrobiales bacterium]
MHVVATAGHVDHGKSTLVHALTGLDPDRLAEEKARGLTIDLGFTWARLPSGAEVSFIDVPGHAQFIRNMLAGVAGVDACLFVVSAVEGWKPQSEEHLRILELLGISRGLVAITKVGLADEETLELAHLAVSEHVAGTFLQSASVVDVDAPSGVGIPELIRGLEQILAVIPPAVDRERPRLWIDRSFSVQGSGAVVTGTLEGGTLAVYDTLEVAPGPGPSYRPLPVRVRAMQNHGSTLSRGGPKQRLAVNVAGMSHKQVGRGRALVRPGQWVATTTIDATLEVLDALDHVVVHRGAYHASLGSGQHAVNLQLIGATSLRPGETGLVRIRLPIPLPLVPGDKYVLRDAGRSETVGGGEVLDVAPLLPVRRAHPDRSLDRVIRERSWVEVGLLQRLTGERVEPNVGGLWVVDPEALAVTQVRLRRAVVEASSLGLDLSPLSAEERAVLSELSDVVVTRGHARLADNPIDASSNQRALAKLEACLFAPPDPGSIGIDRGELRELVRQGRVVERDGIFFAPAAVAEAARVVALLLIEHDQGVSVSDFREALGTTRKFALPLLAQLDATGMTRRRGHVRVAGPLLAAASGSTPDR